MEKTIFFGNGINRLKSSNISWNQVLDKIKGIRKFQDDTLPNTMIYERVILEKPNKYDDLLHDEFDTKNEIAELLDSIHPHELYGQIYDLNAENFITTNYDYAFIDAIKNRSSINLPIHEYSTEDVYSIRRLKSIYNNKQLKKHFWQIHGELRKPATIMLGLDHYCGSIGKIDGFIKGTYSYVKDKEPIKELSIEEKFKSNSFTGASWIELFFTSDIHFFGFSLDYTETDIWWIITKRARMKKGLLRNQIKNKFIMYTDKIDSQKEGLLKSLDVEVIILDVSKSADKYNDFYRILLSKLKSEI